MRIFKTKHFARFVRQEGIDDSLLRAAVERAEKGLIDANLGGGVIKQRVARPGEGKSGGYRTIILFRAGGRSFFVYGFAKNEKDNITRDEREAFKKLATEIQSYSDEGLAKAIRNGALIEVTQDDENKDV